MLIFVSFCCVLNKSAFTLLLLMLPCHVADMLFRRHTRFDIIFRHIISMLDAAITLSLPAAAIAAAMLCR